jgi:hypothetical protein
MHDKGGSWHGGESSDRTPARLRKELLGNYLFRAFLFHCRIIKDCNFNWKFSGAWTGGEEGEEMRHFHFFEKRSNLMMIFFISLAITSIFNKLENPVFLNRIYSRLLFLAV